MFIEKIQIFEKRKQKDFLQKQYETFDILYNNPIIPAKLWVKTIVHEYTFFKIVNKILWQRKFLPKKKLKTRWGGEKGGKKTHEVT